MNDSAVRIQKGAVLVYRVFDVGEEIALARTEACLADYSTRSRAQFLSDRRNAVIMQDAPLKISLGQTPLTLAETGYICDVSAKIWNYGVVSVMLRIPIPEDSPWNELVELAAAIENSPAINGIAAGFKDRITEKIAPAIKGTSDWKTPEDYITYFIERFTGADSPQELLDKANVPELVLAETREDLSDRTRGFIMDEALQYSRHDMAVIDWNSALLIEPDGEMDVADIIEFSLTHLLELRYYDYILGNKLDALYDSIETLRGGIMTEFYARASEDAGRKYIDFSELLERVENSLKTVGDFYLAKVFRTATKKFRFQDWRQSVDRKMATLSELSKLLSGEVNTRRSHWLEIIVIILIAIEVVPFLWTVMAK
ncbi:MAG: hypothetical protein PHW69_08530 [Elusimicrobiaceae bacterium]|nr:hypothetical protein [Elusimicrobiaceae bacterium]